MKAMNGNKPTLIIFLLLISCSPSGDVEQNIAIVCGDDNDQRFCGTAFAVDDTTWLTALHLTEHIENVKIFYDGHWGYAHTSETIPEKDIAVLKTKYINGCHLDVCGEPELKEKVCGCGFDTKLILDCDCGAVLAKENIKWIDGTAFRIEVAARHGWSGAPVLNSDNCVVGMIVGGKNGWSYSYAVDVPESVR